MGKIDKIILRYIGEETEDTPEHKAFERVKEELEKAVEAARGMEGDAKKRQLLKIAELRKKKDRAAIAYGLKLKKK